MLVYKRIKYTVLQQVIVVNTFQKNMRKPRCSIYAYYNVVLFKVDLKEKIREGRCPTYVFGRSFRTSSPYLYITRKESRWAGADQRYNQRIY